MTLDSKADVLHVLNDQAAAYTCPDLQNASNDFQKRHGGITTVNHFLHSEYNSPSDQQSKTSPWMTVALSRTSPELSCWYRPCQCLATYRANGQSPLSQFEHRLADRLHTAGNTLTSRVAGAAKRPKTAFRVEPQGSPGDVFLYGSLVLAAGGGNATVRQGSEIVSQQYMS